MNTSLTTYTSSTKSAVGRTHHSVLPQIKHFIADHLFRRHHRHQQLHNLRVAVAAEEETAAASPSNQTAAYNSDNDIETQTLDYINQCQNELGIDGLISFSLGPDGNPQITLQHPSGASVDISLHGAIVSSWRRPDGKELLHMKPSDMLFPGSSDDDEEEEETAMRGGVEVAFPQYGAGPLPTHGMLRDLHWSVVESACSDDPEDPRPTVLLLASSDDSTEAVYPHSFEAMYTITLMSPSAPTEPNPIEEGREFDKAHSRMWEEELIKNIPQAQSLLQEFDKKREAGLDLAAAEADASPDGSDSAAAPAAPADAPGSRWGRQGLATSPKMTVEEEQAVANADATPSTTLQCSLTILNAGESDMSFTAGVRHHLAIEPLNEETKQFVKVVGLGGKYVLDYTKNPMKPRMGIENQDFIFFGDKDMVRVYLDSAQEGTVNFCPGTRTHFAVRNLEGLRDVTIEHPGVSLPDLASKHVCLGSARKAVPVVLPAGESWTGGVMLTQHDSYWNLPLFEREDPSTVPLPPQDETMPTRGSGGMGAGGMSDTDLLFEDQ